MDGTSNQEIVNSYRILNSEEEIRDFFDILPSDPIDPYELDPNNALSDERENNDSAPSDDFDDENDEPMEINNDSADNMSSSSDDDDDGERNAWEDIDVQDRPWEKYDSEKHKLSNFPFTGENRFICPNANMKTPMEFFELFYTCDLMQKITDESNRYTEAKINRNRSLRQFSIWHDWVPFTLEEMKAFHGVLLNMALIRKQTLKNFFFICSL